MTHLASWRISFSCTSRNSAGTIVPGRVLNTLLLKSVGEVSYSTDVSVMLQKNTLGVFIHTCNVCMHCKQYSSSSSSWVIDIPLYMLYVHVSRSEK